MKRRVWVLIDGRRHAAFATLRDAEEAAALLQRHYPGARGRAVTVDTRRPSDAELFALLSRAEPRGNMSPEQVLRGRPDSAPAPVRKTWF